MSGLSKAEEAGFGKGRVRCLSSSERVSGFGVAGRVIDTMNVYDSECEPDGRRAVKVRIAITLSSCPLRFRCFSVLKGTRVFSFTSIGVPDRIFDSVV